MRDDETRRDNVPAPTAALFGILSDAFDVLDANADEDIALDMFFEEVEFEGEEPRICVTVNDLVSTYHDESGFIVVATFAMDGAAEDGACPWFRRATAVAAAAQTVQVLVDSGFLSEADAETMAVALRSDRDSS